MKYSTLKDLCEVELMRFNEASIALDVAMAELATTYKCTRTHEQLAARCPKQTAAVKRASMDLTRKLADLRQNR